VKKGFTLAEILITLAIVGAIAAITIPTVLVNARQQAFITGAKKANQILNDALKRAQLRSGPMRGWTFDNTTNVFERYFRPQMDSSRVCGFVAQANVANGCFAQEYRQINNAVIAAHPADNTYQVVLADGMAVGFMIGTNGAALGQCATGNPAGNEEARNTRGICGTFIVDINGASGPNLMGRDLFRFVMWGGINAVVPDGTYANWTASTAANNVPPPGRPTAGNPTCTHANGVHCAAIVISTGAMNY
jgi:prepilin-type N-terminal cleavage/methylation domain-containing protein